MTIQIPFRRSGSFTGGAHAATIPYAPSLYAPSATIAKDSPRAITNDRPNITKALGDELTTATSFNFFEMGYGAVVNFTFGPRHASLFTGVVKIAEVTFGNRTMSALESVEVWGGRKGQFVKLGTMSNRTAEPSLTFTGVFDTLQLRDTTPILRGSLSGGFDVDRIQVAPVPVPATGGLLLAGLAGLGALRRRRKAA